MFRITCGYAMTISMLVIASGAGIALADDHDRPPDDGLTAQEASPAVDSVASLSMEGGFSIQIHRASPDLNNTENRGMYFYKPAYILLEQDEPEEDWPAIMRGVEADDTGLTFELHVLSASDKIRDLVRDVILSPEPKGDVDHLKDFNPNALDIQKWPVREVKLAIITDDSAERVLAIGQRQLSNEEIEQGIWRLKMVADAADVDNLKRHVAEGNVRYRYDYRYRGNTVQFANSSTNYYLQAVRAVQSSLEATATAGNGPIFQKEKRDIVKEVEAQTDSVIVANSQTLMQALTPKWEDKIFSGAASLSDLGKPLAPDLLASVESYLERMVDELKTKTLTEDVTTDTNSTKTGMKIETDGSWGSGKSNGAGAGGANPMAWSASLGGEVTKEWLNSSKRVYGVTTTVDETRNVVVATDIDVTYLADNYESAIRRATSEVFLTTPQETGFTPAEITLATRTRKEGKALSLAGRQAPSIPIGGSLCYFGTSDTPPEGYAYLGPGTNWPETSIFDGLKGPMPDVSDRLMGAASSPEQVGRVWASGKIEVPATDVDGKIRVSGQPMVGHSRNQMALNRQGTVWGAPPRYFGMAPASLTPSNTFDPVAHLNLASVPTRIFKPWRITVLPFSYYFRPEPNKAPPTTPKDSWGFQHSVFLKARYFTSPDKIIGSIPKQDIDLSTAGALPSHIKCRWIIRIE